MGNYFCLCIHLGNIKEDTKKYSYLFNQEYTFFSENDPESIEVLINYCCKVATLSRWH